MHSAHASRECRADPQVRRVRAHWLPADEERWRANLGSDDLDEPPELVFYCSDCAEREFEPN